MKQGEFLFEARWLLISASLALVLGCVRIVPNWIIGPRCAQTPDRVGGKPQTIGPSYMTWGHTPKKALKAPDIPTDFEERNAHAKNRNEWKHSTHPQEKQHQT